MGDIHLSAFAQNLSWGFFTKDHATNPGKLDIAVVEATAITEDGGLVLGTGVGVTPEILAIADKIIIEVNTSLPVLRGIHDIVADPRPPHRRPFLISRVDDRIGSDLAYFDETKVVAVVESTLPDNGRGFSAVDENSKKIAGHIMDFFDNEVKQGRLPANLLPLQSGVGNIANAVIGGLAGSHFEHLQGTFPSFSSRSFASLVGGPAGHCARSLRRGQARLRLRRVAVAVPRRL